MTKNNLKVVKTDSKKQQELKEKNKSLEAAISQIDQNFGKGSVMRLGQQQALDVEAISTGSLSLDLALGIGGLPKGRIIETLLLSRLYHPDMLEVDRKAKIDGMPPKLYGRHSLESYGHRLGEYKGNFGETSDWSHWSKEMEDYCEQDVIVTNKLCQHFHPYLTGYN